MVVTAATPAAVLSAALALGGAAWLLRRDFFDRPTRAVALFLATFGFLLATLAGAALMDATSPGAYPVRLRGYAFLALGIAVLYVAAVFPRQRWPVRSLRWPAAPFLLALALLVLVRVLAPAVFQVRPWSLLLALYYPAAGLAAFVLLRDAARAVPGPARQGVVLVASGLLLIPLWEVGPDLRFVASLPQPEAWGWFFQAVQLLGAALGAYALLSPAARDLGFRRDAALPLAALAVAAVVQAGYQAFPSEPLARFLERSVDLVAVAFVLLGHARWSRSGEAPEPLARGNAK